MTDISAAMVKQLRDATPGLPVEFYRDEVDGIESCFLACIGGRPAAIAWAYDHTKPAHFLRMSSGDAEIRSVYSLAEFRGRGYASNLVAGLSRQLLDGGRTFCFLNTDLANPTSNGIYQKIGYRPVCDTEIREFSRALVE